MLEDYHEWLKVADTALPQNLLGYLIQACLSPLRARPFSTSPYDNAREVTKCGKYGMQSFLSNSLPERQGGRPEILRWMAPHRQTSQFAGDEMHRVGRSPDQGKLPC